MSHFFTNSGRMMVPIQRVNVDLAAGMLEELDQAAKELNIRPPGGDQDAHTASARSAVCCTWAAWFGADREVLQRLAFASVLPRLQHEAVPFPLSRFASKTNSFLTIPFP